MGYERLMQGVQAGKVEGEEMKLIHEIALTIADELLTYYGSKEIKAKRLVLEIDKKLDGPGLNYSAIVGRIEAILENEKEAGELVSIGRGKR